MLNAFSDIEEQIIRSQTHGTVLSIKVKGYSTPFVSCVKNFLQSAEIKVVELMPENLYGNPIEKPQILLSEIERITPIGVNYDDPFYVRLRNSKKKFLGKNDP
jgi:hypothetical protein